MKLWKYGGVGYVNHLCLRWQGLLCCFGLFVDDSVPHADKNTCYLVIKDRLIHSCRTEIAVNFCLF